MKVPPHKPTTIYFKFVADNKEIVKEIIAKEGGKYQELMSKLWKDIDEDKK